MDENALLSELQRLRELVASKPAPAEPLHAINSVRQEAGLPQRHWYKSRQRELLAGEHQGKWCWLEYTFGWGTQQLVLRWREGGKAELWRVDRHVRHNPLNPGSEILEVLSNLPFPAAELEQLSHVLHHVPSSLQQCVSQAARQQAQSL